MYDAFDEGEISAREAKFLVMQLLSAGFDSTVFTMATGLGAFADNPRQWQLLRENPSLARPAFDEALRWSHPFRFLGRATTREVELGGVRLGAGERLALFVMAAGRDPRRWERPDDFAIDRGPAGHLGFGFGVHACIGQMVARAEGQAVFSALARRFASIERAGEATYIVNNLAYGYDRLPLRLERA